MRTHDRIIPDARPWDIGWPGSRKAGQFLAALGCYWLLSYADRAILAPAFGYQELVYQAPSPWTQGTVIVLIVACTALTSARLRHPSDGMLYILLSLVVIPNAGCGHRRDLRGRQEQSNRQRDGA
jgi:hypothetical protein